MFLASIPVEFDKTKMHDKLQIKREYELINTDKRHQ